MITQLKQKIKHYRKKAVQGFLRNDPIYQSCKMVVREMKNRGLLVADSYLRTRYGLDLLAVLIACKALLKPLDAKHLEIISLKFLTTSAAHIFSECVNKEEVLCKLYDLKHTVTSAMNAQLQFSGLIREQIVNIRILERIIDSTIFAVNCLDIDFINSNTLALEESLTLLDCRKFKMPITSLSYAQQQNLLNLLLWRGALIAEQAMSKEKHRTLKPVIMRIGQYAENITHNTELTSIKLNLLNQISTNIVEYKLIQKVITLGAKSNDDDTIENDSTTSISLDPVHAAEFH